MTDQNQKHGDTLLIWCVPIYMEVATLYSPFQWILREKAWFRKVKNCMFPLFSVQFVLRLSSGFIFYCNKLEKSHKVLDRVCVWGSQRMR